MVDLSVEFLGVKFKNPIVTAAGTITWSLNNLKRCIEAGVSAVIPKSVILDPNRWERPARQSLFFFDKYNRRQLFTHCSMWFHSPDEQAKLIDEIKPLAQREGVVVMGNILCEASVEGFDEKGIISCAKQLEAAGADMLELPVVCPTTGAESGLNARDRFEKDVQATKFVLSTLKGKLGIPHYVKWGYNSSPAEFLEILQTIETEVNAAHFLPLLPATVVDIETARPVGPVPLLYGHYNAGIGCYFTALAAKSSKLQIMSSGGFWTWRDIVESLMCGASLTGVHCAVVYQGYKRFTQMLNGLTDFMERKGYKKMDDLRGLAVPHIDNAQEIREWLKKRQVPAEAAEILVDDRKCNGCGMCAMCNAEAVTMKDDIARIDLNLCMRCGACATICPRDAISVSFLVSS
ncbi:MAG: 4Fe-4S binding protein [Candidatus Tectomicrobia bacterium]|uniref:dihydrouracil dehydrogenase (NAD(+)) n=1 Tax=Tectimicrobiota bacterium TaxID=2528274 RepID=A0A933GL38_UNCTE|nr:4Fe-4S binding protein [Candidatus Tectomicrobia bacterium]